MAAASPERKRKRTRKADPVDPVIWLAEARSKLRPDRPEKRSKRPRHLKMADISSLKRDAVPTASPAPAARPLKKKTGRRKADDLHRPIRRGLMIALITFGGFGTWSLTAQLSSAVISQGKITVLSNRKKIQHLEGGIVREILVKNGDMVKPGDVLLRLDPTRARASYSINRGRYDTVRATIARLEAERDGRLRISFPADLTIRERDPRIAKIVNAQVSAFNARKEVRDGQAQLIAKRIDQYREEIRGLRAQAASRARQSDLILSELEGLRDLYLKGFASKTRIMALERDAARLQGERGETLAEIARAERAISEAELEISQLKTAFREKVVDELRERQKEALDLAERVGATADDLQRTDIKAPVGGTVVSLDVHTVGAVADAGQVLMEIVPRNDSLVVEAPIKPRDVDDVLVGLDAEVQLSAFSQRTMGKVRGKVIYVSADRMTDERSGEAYFIAQVEIDRQEQARLGTHKLQPGMPAEVFIKTGTRTPFDYLTSPLTDSFDRAWREN